MSLTFLSVCSGIEAVTVATTPLGWRAAAYSEIEKFPCALLKHRHPNTPNLGDMTKFHEWPKLSIDLIVGGTPCQSFSVAGLRKGLADPRGNLALTFLALADRYRPRWVLWENVPGVLSDQGNAFGQFLAGLAELGYGWSYRVLDAQFFGVPQRRRRVFVVGHLGDWQPAAAVLLEPASLRWDYPPSRKAGEGVAGTLSARAEGGGGLGTDLDLDGGVQVAHSLRADGFDASEDGTGRGTPLVPEIAWALQERDSKGADSSTKDGHLIPIAFDSKRGSEAGEKSPTLRAMGSKESHANAGGQVAVAIPINDMATRHAGTNGSGMDVGKGHGLGVGGESDPMFTLTKGDKHAVATGSQKMAVRRLTPRECEKLQGFPTVIDRVSFELWSDHQKDSARVDIKCLRLPTNALPADAEKNPEYASSADVNLWNDPGSRGDAVHLHVRSSHEQKVHALHSHGRLLWSASGAASKNSCHQSIQLGDIARVLVALSQGAEALIHNGKEVSRANTRSFSLQERGNLFAEIFGHEKKDSAKDVGESLNEAITFIILKAGQPTVASEKQNQIWLCSALLVIASFIPNKIPRTNFAKFVVDIERDYTAIEWSGKPAEKCPDGPRYKALGNSMAVPCIRWIAERIQIVHENLPQ